jgi:hypothetical protein
VSFSSGGTVVYSVYRAADAIHYASATVTAMLTVQPTVQTIAFANPGQQTMGTPLPLTAAATSGLPVGFSVSGPATLAGNVLTFTGPGDVTVTALQPGDASYAAATPVPRTFTVVDVPPPVFSSDLSTAQDDILNLYPGKKLNITGTGTVRYSVDGTEFADVPENGVLFAKGGTYSVNAYSIVGGVGGAISQLVGKNITVPPVPSDLPVYLPSISIFSSATSQTYYSFDAPITLDSDEQIVGTLLPNDPDHPADPLVFPLDFGPNQVYFAVLDQGALSQSLLYQHDFPDMPITVTADDSIQVSWGFFGDAMQYRITRTDPDGGATVFVPTTATQLQDDTAVPGVSYGYSGEVLSPAGQWMRFGSQTSSAILYSDLSLGQTLVLSPLPAVQWFRVTVARDNIHRFFTGGFEGGTVLTLYGVNAGGLTPLASDTGGGVGNFSCISQALPAGTYYLKCAVNSMSKVALSWRLAEPYTTFTMGIIDENGGRVAGDSFFLPNNPSSFPGFTSEVWPWYMTTNRKRNYTGFDENGNPTEDAHNFRGACLGMVCYSRWYFLTHHTTEPPLFTRFADSDSERIVILDSEVDAWDYFFAYAALQDKAPDDYLNGLPSAEVVPYLVGQLNADSPCGLVLSDTGLFRLVWDWFEPHYTHVMLVVGFEQTVPNSNTGYLYVYNNWDTTEDKLLRVPVTDGSIQSPLPFAGQLGTFKYYRHLPAEVTLDDFAQ